MNLLHGFWVSFGFSLQYTELTKAYYDHQYRTTKRCNPHPCKPCQWHLSLSVDLSTGKLQIRLKTQTETTPYIRTVWGRRKEAQKLSASIQLIKVGLRAQDYAQSPAVDVSIRPQYPRGEYRGCTETSTAVDWTYNLRQNLETLWKILLPVVFRLPFCNFVSATYK